MRNYIQTWWTKVNVFDSGHSLQWSIWLVAGTSAEVNSAVSLYISSGLPAGYTGEPQPAGTRFIEMNKKLVIDMLFTIGTGILNADPLSFIQNSATSPRDDPDWPSSDGPRTSTGKVPSAKGPKGHINLSLALYLTLLWQTYLSERKYSVANQVLTELNLWMNNKVTQAEVLDFLSKLPATQ